MHKYNQALTVHSSCFSFQKLLIQASILPRELLQHVPSTPPGMGIVQTYASSTIVSEQNLVDIT
jgi:hypothetical protein